MQNTPENLLHKYVTPCHITFVLLKALKKLRENQCLFFQRKHTEMLDFSVSFLDVEKCLLIFTQHNGKAPCLKCKK